VAGFSGNTSFDAFGDHSGMMFTTYDRDNDLWPEGNCAEPWGGGWWHRACYVCALNADDGLFKWYRLRTLTANPQLRSSRMWLHCK